MRVNRADACVFVHMPTIEYRGSRDQEYEGYDGPHSCFRSPATCSAFATFCYESCLVPGPSLRGYTVPNLPESHDAPRTGRGEIWAKIPQSQSTSQSTSTVQAPPSEMALLVI